MKVKIPQEGGVVQSVRGRDCGKYYVITGVLNENSVLVADGKARTPDHPKKKNLKHLRLLPENIFREGIVKDNSYNCRVARYLKELADKS